MTMALQTRTSFLQKLSVGVVLWALSITASSLLPLSGRSGVLCLAFGPNPSVLFTTRMSTRIAQLQKSRGFVLGSSPNEDDEEEDDGWGTASTASSTAETDRKLNELRSLREEASNKAQAVTTPSSSFEEQPPERDMFIPIMAVVSLLGLFGAYGYETLRLASRGELYLPF